MHQRHMIVVCPSTAQVIGDALQQVFSAAVFYPLYA